MPRVIHFEIPSDEPEKSVDFYNKVFGWKISQWPGQAYWLCSTGEKTEPGIDGAILKKNGPDHTMVNTIQVENLADAIKAVEEHGGVIVLPRMAIPKIGWLAYFKDLDQNIMGIMEADEKAE